MSWAAAALILGALGLYALSKNEQPKCPYCGAFVKRNSRRCSNCSSALRWD